MSARKRATVSVPQAGEALAPELRTAAALPRPEESLLASVHDSTEALRESFRKLEERQQQFQQTAGGFDEQIRRLEQETGQALQAQQAQLLHQMEQAAGMLNGLTSAGLEHLAQEVGQQMRTFEELQSQRSREMAQLYTRLNGLGADQQRKLDTACNWLEAARELALFIQEYYPHDFFQAGELEKAWRQVEQAQAMLEEGMPEAAVLGAQQGYEKLSSLRLELERQQTEWLLLRSRAAERVARLVEQAQFNRQCEALGTDGRKLGVVIDADYWCARRISRLVEETRRIQAQIEDREQAPETAQLCELLSSTLPRLEKELGDNLQQARLAALGAQLRINIADVVVDALRSQGFELQDASYHNDDMRKPYRVRLRNREGSEILVQVSPHPGELERNEVTWQSQDHCELTYHELEQRGREITYALKRWGLRVGETTLDEGETARTGVRPTQRYGIREGTAHYGR